MKPFIAVVVVTLAIVRPSPVLAQSSEPPAQRDVLAELLVEVRGLRQAMERAATVGARIQLLVARVQLQEQRIADAARRLTTVRDELSRVDQQAGAIQGQTAMFEKASPGIPPEQREEMQRMAETFKTQVSLLEKRRQDLSNEESMLMQQVAADQGRWSDVNAQLDDIERTLSAPPKK
jgi:chromosome segregation ATPase